MVILLLIAIKGLRLPLAEYTVCCRPDGMAENYCCQNPPRIFVCCACQRYHPNELETS